jgi:hypothetical protein
MRGVIRTIVPQMGVLVFSVTALLLEDAGRKTYNQKRDRRNMRDHRRDVYIDISGL